MYSRNYFNNKYTLVSDPDKDSKYYARKILDYIDIINDPFKAFDIENSKVQKAFEYLGIKNGVKVTKGNQVLSALTDVAESGARIVLADGNPEVIAQEVGSLVYGVGIPLALDFVPGAGLVLGATATVFKDELKDYGRYSFGKRYSDSKEMYWLLTNPNRSDEENGRISQIMFKSIRSAIPIPTPFTGPLSYGLEDIWYNPEGYKEYQEKIDSVRYNYNPDDYITEPIPGIAENIYNKAAEGLNDVGTEISDIWYSVKNFDPDRALRKALFGAEEWSDINWDEMGTAIGGVFSDPQLRLIGEAGPETIIPLSGSYRSRALDLYARTGEYLGLGNPLGGAALAGAGGPNVNVSGISVSLNGGFDEGELALSIGRQIAAKMKITMENYA